LIDASSLDLFTPGSLKFGDGERTGGLPLPPSDIDLAFDGEPLVCFGLVLFSS
jgi:hypothetical protein